MEITSLSQLDLSKSYTYADYLLWKFKERVELFKGKVLKMSPAPARRHQEVLRNIYRIFDRFFIGSKCEVYFAPFDVRLPNKNGEVKTVVQPDLCVICDLSKLDERGCLGAPDFVAEILSPGNTKRDLDLKYTAYEEAGVLEYWIVHPTDKNIQRFVLRDGIFIGLKPATEDERITSDAFPELSFEVNEVFQDIEIAP